MQFALVKVHIRKQLRKQIKSADCYGFCQQSQTRSPKAAVEGWKQVQIKTARIAGVTKTSLYVQSIVAYE